MQNTKINIFNGTYKKIKIHKDLIKEIQIKGSEIGLPDITSQVSYLIKLGILSEKKYANKCVVNPTLHIHP